MRHIEGFIASDHGGWVLKDHLKQKSPLIDLGAFGCNLADDYPDFSKKLCKYVLKERSKGIMICRSGIGSSIACNRFKGIRAALCRTVRDAQMAREHNDANVLVLGADVTSKRDAEKIVKKFFYTKFSGEKRHVRRIRKLDRS